MKIFRVILGTLVGVAFAIGVAVYAEDGWQEVYPARADLDWSDAAAVKRFMETMPFGAMSWLLAGWVGATFIGALTGSAFARARAVLISTIVGGCMLAATIANFLLTPYPSWVVVVDIAGIVAATWLAAKLMSKQGMVVSSA
jgi:hypothetical protein